MIFRFRTFHSRSNHGCSKNNIMVVGNSGGGEATYMHQFSSCQKIQTKICDNPPSFELPRAGKRRSSQTYEKVSCRLFLNETKCHNRSLDKVKSIVLFTGRFNEIMVIRSFIWLHLYIEHDHEVNFGEIFSGAMSF